MLIARLVTHDLGVIVCCNILDGLQLGLYDRQLVQTTFKWWESWCKYSGITSPEKTVYALRDLVFDTGNIPDSFWAGVLRPDLAFIAKRRAGGGAKNKVAATIMPAERLADKMTDMDLVRLENSFGVKLPKSRREWTATIIDRVQKLPDAERVFTIPTITQLHPICLWYTREADFLSRPGVAASSSNAARDSLGLVHYEAGTPVAVLYFFRDELEGGLDDRPTFTEAADNRRFKSRPDKSASRKLSSWGHAADLDRVANGRKVIDGCAERICKPQLHSFQIRFDVLGSTSGIRGNLRGTDSDDLFASLLVDRSSGGKKTTLAEIEARLRIEVA
jgi:hypothetical protein